MNQTLFNQLQLLHKVETLIKLNQHEFIYQLGSQPLVVLSTWKNYLPLEAKWNFRLAFHSPPLNDTHLLHFNGKSVKGFMFSYISEYLILKRKIPQERLYYRYLK